MKYDVVIEAGTLVTIDEDRSAYVTVVDDNIMEALDEPVPPSKTFRLAHYHHEDGVRVAVVGEPGRKWIYAAVFDAPIRLLKLPLDEQKYMKDLTETTAAKAAKKMLNAGRRLGITESAKTFLRSVE